jgi:Domain of unknown function (DUF4062)
MTRIGDLLIDLGAYAALPDERTFREWATGRRVFISSVMSEFKEERKRTATAIDDVGAIPVWFEDFGGRDWDPEVAYVEEVRSSDIYVGMIGKSYGAPSEDGYSATEAEYLTAVQAGLRIAVWATSTESREDSELRFLQEVRRQYVTGTFSSAEQLSTQIVRRLREICRENLAEWVKVGDAVVRAEEVRNNGKVIVIRARVVDSDVRSHLEQLRTSSALSYHRTNVVTHAGRSFPMRLENVEMQSGSSRHTSVEITAAVTGQAPNQPSIAYNVAGRSYSSHDAVEAGVRAVVLGEPTEFSLGVPKLAFSWDRFHGFRLSVSVVAALAYLLLAEELVLGGHVARITSLHLGPVNHGRSQLSLAWEEPLPYVGSNRGRSRMLRGEVLFSEPE